MDCCLLLVNTLWQDERSTYVKVIAVGREEGIVMIKHLPNAEDTEWMEVDLFHERFTRLRTLPKGIFPEELSEFAFEPSLDMLNENLMIFFHGMGDDHRPFARLGKEMQLPQTATLAIRAPIALPFDLGYAWIESITKEGDVMQPNEESYERCKSLEQSRALLQQLIKSLCRQFDWGSERIFLFGFSQGGFMALDTVCHFPRRLGGAVVVSSGFIDRYLNAPLQKDSFSKTPASCIETPLLLIQGEKDDVYPIEYARKTLTMYKNKFPGAESTLETFAKGHEMISNKDEMRAVMKFLARSLFLRNLHLERQSDIVEVKSVSPMTVQ